MSQAELARAIGVPQQNVAYWELSDKPPNSAVLPKLAHILGVRLEALLSPSTPPEAAARPGPRGRLLKTFEAAASLPRQQQLLVEQFVSALLAQHKGRAA